MTQAAKTYNAACIGIICIVAGISLSGLVPATYTVGWMYGLANGLVAATWFWKVIRA